MIERKTAPFSGREQVQGAAHRSRLDEAPLDERAVDLAGPRRLASHANRELGGGRDLRLSRSLGGKEATATPPPSPSSASRAERRARGRQGRVRTGAPGALVRRVSLCLVERPFLERE